MPDDKNKPTSTPPAKPSDDPGKGGTEATKGNQSTSTVAPPAQPEKQTPGTPPVGQPRSEPNATNVAEVEKARNEPGVRDAEFEKALNEPDTTNVTEADLDAKDAEDFRTSKAGNAVAKVQKLVKALSATPDSHSIYGYGGISLSLGDLRDIAGHFNLD